MHVHSNYSLQLAALGVGQPTTQEIAARRSTEVRKKLSIAAGALNETGDETTSVHAHADEQRHGQRQREPNEDEFGTLFSARV